MKHPFIPQSFPPTHQSSALCEAPRAGSARLNLPRHPWRARITSASARRSPREVRAARAEVRGARRARSAHRFSSLCSVPRPRLLDADRTRPAPLPCVRPPFTQHPAPSTQYAVRSTQHPVRASLRVTRTSDLAPRNSIHAVRVSRVGRDSDLGPRPSELYSRSTSARCATRPPGLGDSVLDPNSPRQRDCTHKPPTDAPCPRRGTPCAGA
jgi:hypothetical protein